MKKRLVAGTINRYYPDDDFQNWHLDVSPREIWDPVLEMGVLPEFVGSIADLSQFREGTFDEVKAHHVLEHLVHFDVNAAIESVHRVLVPGGVFDVEVPDVVRVAEAMCADELTWPEYNQWLYGEVLANHEDGDTHRSGWSQDSLADRLRFYGFEVGVREDTGLALRFRAVKPHGTPDV